MPFRTEIRSQVVLDGRPHTVLVLDNPTIEDVLVVEMRLRAAELANGVEHPEHRVSRDIRDILIRTGVER